MASALISLYFTMNTSKTEVSIAVHCKSFAQELVNALDLTQVSDVKVAWNDQVLYVPHPTTKVLVKP